MAPVDDGATTPNPDGLTAEWQRTDRPYPFTGDHGEFVCNEWQRFHDNRVVVKREFYHLDKINQKIAGTIPMDEAARAFVRSSGIERVSTCDDARRFFRLQHEYFESQPSLVEPDIAPLPTSPGSVTGTGTTGDPIDKVQQGYEFHFPKSVRVRIHGGYDCTGFLINKWVILTAAHCIPASGFYKVTVDYGTGQPNSCIDGDSGPNCTSAPPNPNFLVGRHYNFTGYGDTADDLAVFIHWTWNAWAKIGDNPANYMQPTTWAPTGASFWIHGYGANDIFGRNSGLGRAGNGTEKVHWSSSGYWYAIASNGPGRICSGDSGGAGIHYWGAPPVQWDLAIGVASDIQIQDPDQHCPLTGDKFRYQRFTYSKASWLNRTLAENQAGACALQNLGADYTYWKCW